MLGFKTRTLRYLPGARAQAEASRAMATSVMAFLDAPKWPAATAMVTPTFCQALEELICDRSFDRFGLAASSAAREPYIRLIDSAENTALAGEWAFVPLLEDFRRLAEKHLDA